MAYAINVDAAAATAATVRRMSTPNAHQYSFI
jgi:hypothetical protein